MGWPLALGGLGVCLLYLAAELYLVGGFGFPLDDSWIHLQFARNLAGGEGLAYRPGEWATGSTAPLWTALLALGFLVPGAAVAWSKLLGVALYLASADAAARLAGELGLSRGWRLLSAALVLATPWLVWSALSGMEVLLFTALGLWGMVLHLRERRRGGAPPASLAVFGLACLARPEGWALLGLAAADRLLHLERSGEGLAPRPPRWRELAEGLALALVVVLPTLVFYRVVGGSFLPSTFAVKAAPVEDLLPSGRYLRTVVDILFRSQPLALLAAGAGALALIERLGTRRDRGLLPALWPLGLPLAYSLLAPDAGHLPVGNFGRYYFPLLPVVVVLAALGLEATAARLETDGGRLAAGGLRWGGRRLPVRALLVAGLFLPQVWGLGSGCLLYSRTVANVEDSDVRAARWLAERLPPEALVAVQDIGALGYHLPNRIVDLAGIVTPEILPALKGGAGDVPERYWEERVLAFLAERRPDYLVVFPASYPMLTSAVAGIEEVESFAVEDNRAMAGDELAVFTTPWTRHPLLSGPPAGP